METLQQPYDVVIIGGGITGCALFEVLAQYTNVPRVLLVEAHEALAQVSSRVTNNSQTLHVGDLETHYSVEKATDVQRRSGYVARYVDQFGAEGTTHRCAQRMVLAVGEQEVADLRAHYERIRHLFPDMEVLDRDGIARVEPAVMEGRPADEAVLALYTSRGYVMNFGAVAELFVKRAQQARGTGFDVRLGARIAHIAREGDEWRLQVGEDAVQAKRVVVATGAYSLGMAHALGYAKELTMIPVAGYFYEAPNVLKGKVYTMQIPGLPFAAIHGDPEVTAPEQMRFGPIPVAVPFLEPRVWSTLWAFLRQFTFDWATLRSMIAVNTDPKLVRFLAKSLLYRLPVVGRRAFIQDVRKVVPSMQPSALRFGKDLGGIRPQVVDTTKRVIRLGVAKIKGDGILFNVTPSPGASVCLASGREDAEWLMQEFGGMYQFDVERFERDLS